jgi:hypothetical protein
MMWFTLVPRESKWKRSNDSLTKPMVGESWTYYGHMKMDGDLIREKRTIIQTKTWPHVCMVEHTCRFIIPNDGFEIIKCLPLQGKQRASDDGFDFWDASDDVPTKSFVLGKGVDWPWKCSVQGCSLDSIQRFAKLHQLGKEIYIRTQSIYTTLTILSIFLEEKAQNRKKKH